MQVYGSVKCARRGPTFEQESGHLIVGSADYPHFLKGEIVVLLVYVAMDHRQLILAVYCKLVFLQSCAKAFARLTNITRITVLAWLMSHIDPERFQDSCRRLWYVFHIRDRELELGIFSFRSLKVGFPKALAYKGPRITIGFKTGMQVLSLLLLPTVVTAVYLNAFDEGSDTTTFATHGLVASEMEDTHGVTCFPVDRCPYFPICQLSHLYVEEGQLIVGLSFHCKLDVGKDGVQKFLESLHFAPFDDDESVINVSGSEFRGKELKNSRSSPCKTASAISVDIGVPFFCS
ncbi:unnamed protein product [Schistocephalus solidus]|uniref:CUB domain-containing protein n=1 Tax=Schistocephalus solidus TaxID=70667 RepID=A0A183TL48_SCHSO|nr:unnamed protein product [Schistocephalus solidus]